MEKILIGLYIASNLVWFGVATWLNRSWHEEYRRMNKEWSDFVKKTINVMRKRGQG